MLFNRQQLFVSMVPHNNAEKTTGIILGFKANNELLAVLVTKSISPMLFTQEVQSGKSYDWYLRLTLTDMEGFDIAAMDVGLDIVLGADNFFFMDNGTTPQMKES